MGKFLMFILFFIVNTLAFAEGDFQNASCVKNKNIFPGTEMTRQLDYAHGRSGLDTGYHFIAEMGYGFKLNNDDDNFLKVNVINGYRVNPHFYLGLGTGLRLYLDPDFFGSLAAFPVIPFFADFRVNFIHTKVSPYLALDTGYSFDASDGFMGLGFLLNPTAGLNLAISEKLMMNVGLGYDMQFWKNYNSNRAIDHGAISINIGITF